MGHLQLKKNEDKIDKIFLLIKILLLLINFIKTNTLLSIYILKEEIYSQPIHYLLKIMDNCLSVGLSFVEIKENANFIFDHTDKNSVQINIEFFRSLIIEKNYNYNHYFRQKPIIYFKDGQKKIGFLQHFISSIVFRSIRKKKIVWKMIYMVVLNMKALFSIVLIVLKKIWYNSILFYFVEGI